MKATDRREKFTRRSNGLFDQLRHMNLNRLAVSVPALTSAGMPWDGSVGRQALNTDFEDASQGVSFVPEKGNPFTEIRLMCDMVTEIQFMLPSVNIVLSPTLKTPFKPSLAKDLPRYARHMHFDKTLGKNFLYVPFGFSVPTATIFLTTEQFDDSFMRNGYRSVWDILEGAIQPSWLEKIERERILATSRSEFDPTPTDTSIPDYLDQIKDDAKSPQIDRMMSWAGTGFESYVMNLRLLHAVPYIAEDEDENLIFPRYAELYHAILDGNGDSWLTEYRRKSGLLND